MMAVSLCLILLSRSHSAFLFVCFHLQSLLLKRNLQTELESIFFYLSCYRMSFFALENSNSLSSLDISNAYIGLEGYNPALVGSLAFLSNWAGPLWWIVAAVSTFSNMEKRLSFSPLPFLAIFESWTTFLLSLSVMFMRHHLFIWTVFSPRYLYQIVWVVLGVFTSISAYFWHK